jgi:hypothetical protein
MKSESVSKRQREQDLPQSTEVVVDEAAGMIRNVKLLGLESAWGNVYPVEVIERSIRQYEGAPCYLNHGGNEIRPVQELYGTICGVRMTESGPRGDIRYNPALPLSPGIVWWAKNEPARLSMSHDAQLKGTRTKEGKFLVEEIQKVYSVDIVTRGATTSGFKESHPGSKRKRAMEDYSMNPADPAAPAAESAADEATDYISHLCNSLMALLKDPGMDAGEKKKKAKAIIKLALDEGGAGDGSDTTTATEGDDMKDDKVKESLRILMDSTDPNVKRVLEAYDRLSVSAVATKRGSSVAELVKDLPRHAVTDIFLRQLESAPDDATRRKLVQDRRILAGVRTPTSAAPDPLPMGGGRAQEGAGKQVPAVGKTVKARSPAEVRAAIVG